MKRWTVQTWPCMRKTSAATLIHFNPHPTILCISPSNTGTWLQVTTVIHAVPVRFDVTVRPHETYPSSPYQKTTSSLHSTLELWSTNIPNQTLQRNSNWQASLYSSRVTSLDITQHTINGINNFLETLKLHRLITGLYTWQTNTWIYLRH